MLLRLKGTFRIGLKPESRRVGRDGARQRPVEGMGNECEAIEREKRAYDLLHRGEARSMSLKA